MDQKWRRILTHDGGDVSIISERESLEFFWFLFFHLWDLWVYEPGQDCSPHWSDLRPLTISDSDGEVIIMGSHSEKLHLFRHLYGHESLIISNPRWDKPAQQLKWLLGFSIVVFVDVLHKEVFLISSYVSFLLRLLPLPVSVHASQTVALGKRSHRNAKVKEGKAKTCCLVFSL